MKNRIKVICNQCYQVLPSKGAIHMEKVNWGKTGLSVTRSAFGALPIQRLTRQDAVRLLNIAYDNGINFYDTARSYSDSEEKLGCAFHDKRDKLIIATKTQCKTPQEFWEHLSVSLTKLQTDYIDIYQFHNIERIPLENSPLYECMLKAREQGKIRHIGVTCHKLSNARTAANSELYETIQYPLSALSSAEEIIFAGECGDKKIGVIAMKALAGGILKSASFSMAYLRALPHVIPIWGFQFEHELREVLELEKNPPLLDTAMMEAIEKCRKELTGDFCRGCGYCMPCTVDIKINWIARMPQLLRRLPYAQFYAPEWKKELEKVENCTECRSCMERCPYELQIIELLRKSAEDYKKFGREHSFDLA
jgi:aryl-alcohol dehydrogenase-like predicted oxidoreductase